MLLHLGYAVSELTHNDLRHFRGTLFFSLPGILGAIYHLVELGAVDHLVDLVANLLFDLVCLHYVEVFV